MSLVAKVLKPKTQSLASMLDPLFSAFSPNMWIVVVLSPVAAGFILWVLEMGSSSPDFNWELGFNPRRMVYQLQHSFWLATGAVTGSQGHKPTTMHGKYFAVFWCLYAVMLYANYMASITSILISPPPKYSVSSFEALSLKNMKTCVKFNTAYFQMFLRNHESYKSLDYVFRCDSCECDDDRYCLYDEADPTKKRFNFTGVDGDGGFNRVKRGKLIEFPSDMAQAIVAGECDGGIDGIGHQSLNVNQECPNLQIVDTLEFGPRDFGIGLNLKHKAARDSISYYLTTKQATGDMRWERIG